MYEAIGGSCAVMAVSPACEQCTASGYGSQSSSSSLNKPLAFGMQGATGTQAVVVVEVVVEVAVVVIRSLRERKYSPRTCALRLRSAILSIPGSIGK